MSEIKLREDYIKLGQALKAAGSVGSGCKVCDPGWTCQSEWRDGISERKETL